MSVNFSGVSTSNIWLHSLLTASVKLEEGELEGAKTGETDGGGVGESEGGAVLGGNVDAVEVVDTPVGRSHFKH